jgi:4-amino-4-deoxy-L-arabinose transferase-like glycosyltransferase
MLRPLNYHTVCPVLFSWVQLTAIKLLGFNEYALRLFSFLCGLGSLFLFRHFAGRLLKGTAMVLAVALFAVSYPTMR